MKKLNYESYEPIIENIAMPSPKPINVPIAKGYSKKHAKTLRTLTIPTHDRVFAEIWRL